jgi:hypothetical protein
VSEYVFSMNPSDMVTKPRHKLNMFFSLCHSIFLFGVIPVL